MFFQDRREGFMKNASSFILFCLVQNIPQFFKVESFVQPPTHSLPYTEHGTPHFHTEHHLNRLPHEYIST
jgi:hypothetical protein